MRSLKSRDLAAEQDTFEVAMFCYVGMSDNAILKHMPKMTKGKIQYRIQKIRKRYNIDIRRSDYRNGNNILARKTIANFGPLAKKKLLLNDLS